MRLRIRLARERNRGIELKTRWIPGHADVRGNERADVEAKLASAHMHPTDELLPLSLGGEIPINPSAVKRMRRAGMALNWKTWTREEGDARRTETHTREIDPDYLSMQFSKDAGPLTRLQLATVTQLRTGHYPTRSYLHRFTMADSPTCTHCDTRSETVDHLLMGCRALDDLRRERDREIGDASRSIKTLLKPGEHMVHVLHFLQEARRRQGVTHETDDG